MRYIEAGVPVSLSNLWSLSYEPLILVDTSNFDSRSI
jgi:hypothetical protein